MNDLLPNNVVMIASPLSTNVLSTSAKNTYCYFECSDSDDASKSFICSSLSVSFRNDHDDECLHDADDDKEESCASISY